MVHLCDEQMNMLKVIVWKIVLSTQQQTDHYQTTTNTAQVNKAKRVIEIHVNHQNRYLPMKWLVLYLECLRIVISILEMWNIEAESETTQCT